MIIDTTDPLTKKADISKIIHVTPRPLKLMILSYENTIR